MTMTKPGYWMNETSGVLKPVVEKYLRGEQLSQNEVACMIAYLRQWMAGDFCGPEIDMLRVTVNAIVDHETLVAWLDEAMDAGIDPL
jgi:hypothetical protein